MTRSNKKVCLLMNHSFVFFCPGRIYVIHIAQHIHYQLISFTCQIPSVLQILESYWFCAIFPTALTSLSVLRLFSVSYFKNSQLISFFIHSGKSGRGDLSVGLCSLSSADGSWFCNHALPLYIATQHDDCKYFSTITFHKNLGFVWFLI